VRQNRSLNGVAKANNDDLLRQTVAVTKNKKCIKSQSTCKDRSTTGMTAYICRWFMPITAFLVLIFIRRIFLSTSNVQDALASQHNILSRDFTYMGFSKALMAKFLPRPFPQGGAKSVLFGLFSVRWCNILRYLYAVCIGRTASKCSVSTGRYVHVGPKATSLYTERCQGKSKILHFAKL